MRLREVQMEIQLAEEHIAELEDKLAAANAQGFAPGTTQFTPMLQLTARFRLELRCKDRACQAFVLDSFFAYLVNVCWCSESLA